MIARVGDVIDFFGVRRTILALERGRVGLNRVSPGNRRGPQGEVVWYPLGEVQRAVTATALYQPPPEARTPRHPLPAERPPARPSGSFFWRGTWRCP